ncbi:MAG: hypothetical protein HYU67_08640 [Flavobacteriia bacterium]|nr:hypothetical protein [Flavobacteriia bacterium]
MNKEFKKKFFDNLSENKLIIIQHSFSFSPVNQLLNQIEKKHKNFDLSDKNVFKEINSLHRENYSSFFDSDLIIIHHAQLIHSLEELVLWCLQEQDKKTFVLFCSAIPTINEDLFSFFKTHQVFSSYHETFLNEIEIKGMQSAIKELKNILVFGSSISFTENKQREDFYETQLHILLNLLSLKDNKVNKKEKLIQILRYLSMKSGENCSYLEMGIACGLDNETAEKYIHLLKDYQVIIQLKSIFNEHRYEIKKGNSFYFYDNGFRNYLIQQFQLFEQRFDQDFLWRNWLIAEKYKINAESKYSFWLTHTKQKIEFIEENSRKSTSNAYIFQWDKRKVKKAPTSFLKYYPQTLLKVIHQSNFIPFLLEKN